MSSARTGAAIRRLPAQRAKGVMGATPVMSTAPRITVRDIAAKAGVHFTTVALALRDSPMLNAETKRRVKELAESMGYRPDPMLASLVAYRQGKRGAGIQASLAWINQWETPEDLRFYKEFDNYWLGAAEAASRLGYRLEEFRWPHGKSGKRLQTILQTRGVRGILIPPHRDGLDLSGFDWSQFSLVKFGASVMTVRAHEVTSDQGHCSRLAYVKAAELGYRRIGYVSDIRFEHNTRGHFRDPIIRICFCMSAWFSKPNRDGIRMNCSSGSKRRSRTRSLPQCRR